MPCAGIWQALEVADTFISDEGFSAILASCSRLRKLDMSNCSLVTAQSLWGMRRGG